MRQSLACGEVGNNGISMHLFDWSHWHASIVSVLSAVGIVVELGEIDEDSDGSNDCSTEGCCEGCADDDGEFDAATDGRGDKVGGSD